MAVLISSAMLLAACDSSNLQGKFSTTAGKSTPAASSSTTKATPGSKVKVATGSSSSSSSSESSSSSSSSTTTTTSTPTLLTITPSTNSYNTISLSTYDAADEDSQWYAIGKYTYAYSSDATICSDINLMLNDGSTSFQYQSWFDDVFPDTRLQFRDSSNTFIQYVYPKTTGNGYFTVSGLGLPTTGYFYVEARSPETIDSRYKDKKLYVYLSRMCAEKDGETYLWMNDNGNSENAYFSATADAVTGITGGWTMIQD